MSIGLGSMKAKFNGEVELLELDEPNRAKLKAHGITSGSAANVVSEMILINNSDSKTIVHWTADVNISGQLARLASRLMMPISQKLTRAFYGKVRKRIEMGGI